jgi:hypothetical protein
VKDLGIPHPPFPVCVCVPSLSLSLSLSLCVFSCAPSTCTQIHHCLNLSVSVFVCPCVSL